MTLFKALIVTLAAGAVTLDAQLPAPPFARGTFETAGLMALRNSPAFRATITEKKGTAGNFTLALEQTNGTRQTFTVIGGSEGERKMFDHFKLGARYDFPQVFDDVLGKEVSSSTARTSITTSTFPASATPFSPFPSDKLALLDLSHCAPFRAKIDAKTIAPDVISITIACTDGRTLTLRHSGNLQMNEALKIAQPLEQGRFYEFPMSVPPPHQDEPAPPTPAMKALEPFIGEWDGETFDKPGQKSRLHCHWKLDGTGLWRELSLQNDGRDEYRMASATLITHDSATGRYVEIHTRPGGPPPVEKIWDASGRTFTSVVLEDRVTPPRKITTISTVKTDDRIDWKTTITTTEGQFIEEHQGRYTRIKP